MCGCAFNLIGISVDIKIHISSQNGADKDFKALSILFPKQAMEKESDFAVQAYLSKHECQQVAEWDYDTPPFANGSDWSFS